MNNFPTIITINPGEVCIKISPKDDEGFDYIFINGTKEQSDKFLAIIGLGMINLALNYTETGYILGLNMADEETLEELSSEIEGQLLMRKVIPGIDIRKIQFPEKTRE